MHLTSYVTMVCFSNKTPSSNTCSAYCRQKINWTCGMKMVKMIKATQNILRLVKSMWSWRMWAMGKWKWYLRMRMEPHYIQETAPLTQNKSLPLLMIIWPLLPQMLPLITVDWCTTTFPLSTSTMALLRKMELFRKPNMAWCVITTT